jgi:hypothetical protein
MIDIKINIVPFGHAHIEIGNYILEENTEDKECQDAIYYAVPQTTCPNQQYLI